MYGESIIYLKHMVSVWLAGSIQIIRTVTGSQASSLNKYNFCVNICNVYNSTTHDMSIIQVFLNDLRFWQYEMLPYACSKFFYWLRIFFSGVGCASLAMIFRPTSNYLVRALYTFNYRFKIFGIGKKHNIHAYSFILPCRTR